MAGKGKHAKGKKRPKHGKKAKEKKVNHVGEEEQAGSVENDVLGREEKTNEKNGESEKNDVFSKEDYELLEGINITSSNSPDNTEESSRAKIPHYPLSAYESAFLKSCMEEKIATLPVHTPECGHPNLGRDIEDCGGNYELVERNCDMLMNCYEDDKTGYPYIIKKAFKYIKDHQVRKDAFFPSKDGFDLTLEIPEEVKALRITGFQMVDHKDEFALMNAVREGPFVAGVRHSPEFTVLGNKIYKGSDNEIKIEGKFCNHGIVVMGYDSDKKRKTRYWIVMNSDGTRWGEGGFGKVARDSSLPEHRKHLLTTTMFPVFE